MDTVKNPAVMGSVVATAAVAGVAIYFTKQTKAIKEDISNINDEINILKTDDAQRKINDGFTKVVGMLLRSIEELNGKVENMNMQVYVMTETLLSNNLKVPDNLKRKSYDRRSMYGEYSPHSHHSHHIAPAPQPRPQQRDVILDEIRSVMASIGQGDATSL